MRGSALIKMAGSANQSLDATDALSTGSSERWLPSLEIATTGGTVSWFGNFRIRSNYTFTSGSLNAGTSTLVFENRNNSFTLRPGGSSVVYNNVIFRTSGGSLNMNSGDVMKILGTLTLDNSYSFGASINNGTLEAHGNVILSEYGIKGTGKVKIAGDSTAGDVNQTIDASGAIQGWLPELEIATNNLSVSLLGNLYVYGNYTWTSGSVIAGTSTMLFESFNGSRTHTPGVPIYNHIIFTGSAGIHNINGTFKVGGNLTLANIASGSGTLNGGAIDIYGNLIATNYGYKNGNTALTMKGSASASISQSSSMWWASVVSAVSGACFASIAIRYSFVETAFEPGVSAIFPSIGSVTRRPLPSTGSFGIVPPLPRYYWALRLLAVRPGSLRFLRSPVPIARYLFALLGQVRTAREPGGLMPLPRSGVSTETARSPKFLGTPWLRALLFDPGGTAALGLYSASVLPSALSTASAPATNTFRGSIIRPASSPSTLRRAGHPATTQDSLPAAWPASPGGLGYPQGSFARFHFIHPPCPGFAWRKLCSARRV